MGGGASTSESLSSVSDNRCKRDYENRKVENEGNLSDKGQRFCNKRGAEICENSYQAYKIIGGYNYSKDIFGNTWNGLINGKYVYKRILIQRIK